MPLHGSRVSSQVTDETETETQKEATQIGVACSVGPLSEATTQAQACVAPQAIITPTLRGGLRTPTFIAFGAVTPRKLSPIFMRTKVLSEEMAEETTVKGGTRSVANRSTEQSRLVARHSAANAVAAVTTSGLVSAAVAALIDSVVAFVRQMQGDCSSKLGPPRCLQIKKGIRVGSSSVEEVSHTLIRPILALAAKGAWSTALV